MTILILDPPFPRSPSLHEKSSKNSNPLVHPGVSFSQVCQRFPKSREAHKPSGTPKRLAPKCSRGFQKSREAYKTSGTPRSLILPNVPEVLKNPEKPTKPLVHIRGSLPSVPGVGYKDLIESLRRSAAMLPQSLRVHTLSDARRPL